MPSPLLRKTPHSEQELAAIKAKSCVNIYIRTAAKVGLPIHTFASIYSRH